MGDALLILVPDEKYMHHVINLTNAAHARGKRVQIIFCGRGVNLVRDPGFAALAETARISICQASFRDYGLAEHADRIPAIATARLTTHARHVELLAQSDRHIVL